MSASSRIIEIYGWLGTAAILTVFTLASFDIVELEGLFAASLNAVGCLGVALASQRRRAFQAATINYFLGAVATIAIIRALL